MISTLMEEHAHSRWFCALVTDANDTRLRVNEFTRLLVDTGAIEPVCGLLHFTDTDLLSGPRLALETATSELLKCYGQRPVDFRHGEEGQRYRNVHPSWQAEFASIRLRRGCTHTAWWSVRSAMSSLFLN